MRKTEITAGGNFGRCLPEVQLKQEMTETVEPFLKEIRQEGRMAETEPASGTYAPGSPFGLYYELYPQKNAKGTIVISFGFTESCLKYHELIWYFYREGYQAAIIDHRGHGKSLREVEDSSLVHVDRFSRYVKELHKFVHELAMPMAQGGPLFLFAHSMGGCVGAIYLEQYPDDFDRAILNAPMLGLNLGGCPPWAARILCDMKIAVGKGKERLFTQAPFDPQEPFEGCAAGSLARHLYYLELRRADASYQTSSATYYWGREAINSGKFAIQPSLAGRVRTPVLLFQAQLDTLVSPKAQEIFVSRIPEGRLAVVKGARHEIYRSSNDILEPYLEELFGFLAEGRRERPV